ncbi:MAG: uracil-DNA glycosylase family protein [Pyrinomonadaceae bacterium]
MPNSELNNLIADVREQVLYLRELGVEAMDVELSDVGSISDSGVIKPPVPVQNQPGVRSEIPKVEIPNIQSTKPAEPSVPGQSRLASLPSLASLSKKPQTVTPPVVAKKPESAAEVINNEPATEAVSGSNTVPAAEIIVTEQPTKLAAVVASVLPEPTETIEQIRAGIGPDCTRCKLATLGRSKVVNSTGNFNADLMFVGEAPGADEDEQGFPFVGRAGQLLTKIIESIGVGREDVFIGNINRCRPPGNRAPEADETIACKPFLKREIAVVRPKVIVVLGATAAQNLLETKVPIGKLRGHFHDYLGTKVMPTFHPAYLLRDPHKKREVWEDMKMVRDYLATT